MNPLALWIEENGGPPAKERLRIDAGVRWQTVHEIAEGRSVPRLKTLTALEQSTTKLGVNGGVKAVDLLAWFVAHPPANSSTPATPASPPSEVNSDHAAE